MYNTSNQIIIKLFGKIHRKKSLENGVGNENFFNHDNKIIGNLSKNKYEKVHQTEKLPSTTTKRQLMAWKEIFANHTSEKRLISEILKELYNCFASKKIIQ